MGSEMCIRDRLLLPYHPLAQQHAFANDHPDLFVAGVFLVLVEVVDEHFLDHLGFGDQVRVILTHVNTCNTAVLFGDFLQKHHGILRISGRQPSFPSPVGPGGNTGVDEEEGALATILLDGPG